ncbi:ATP-dependent DNA helicase mph1 [Psilocybe cubensis]|uniref:ATP-dependent DNA helicase mph1 n=1 Tax=Psilocybe cubensis TaxID=181762 RepID=A0ACB8HIF3_PSICU|nr:ATP-dependent DNA helicase mph1 [Psilocybe cubensis]KAH9487144.1 ATP-dependent DNA helicase mph1 [Psilocybe cubensis]
MSSDGYFEGDDDLDLSALQQLDAIEAAHFSPRKTEQQQHISTSPIPPAKTSRKSSSDSSFYDLTFDVDETDLAKLDTFIEDSYAGKAQPVAGPSKIARTSSKNMLQTTLFGDVLPPSSSVNPNKPSRSQAEKPQTERRLFGQQAPKTKRWDQTAYAKSGTRKSKGKGKENHDSDEENVEFEQFPAPFISDRYALLHLTPPPMKVTADLLEAKHWIYPINRPKRDYQYNIVKNSLFENTLVALPTGLGKTFIAGVVMLNYYRWFPDGKIIFVAPTKPLVTQQIEACHDTCGIPNIDSAELNGEVPAATRARYWREKRVFFMTPQTLMNDLVKQNCDHREIVLLVIDEAHRASGDYAYNQVVRFLMAKNPHFRVLALTATPGNTVEAVQTLIDGLHISRIELRNEESVDLQKYLFKKTVVTHIIKPNEDLMKIRDLLVKVMDPHIKQLIKFNVLRPNESAISMHPFRPQALMSESGPQHFTALSALSKLARVMMYLLTGSFETCYLFLNELRTEVDKDIPGAARQNNSSKRFKNDPGYVALMKEVEAQRQAGWGIHPKIEKLKTILIQHFGSKLADNNGEEDTSKVMVFSSYRGVVQELVNELNKESPLIRATEFIGQGTDKQGKKGLQQKEQLEVIKKFKQGVYNVLVATSIGEEGLDIGEIDVTVCYDTDKTPTRMIQRFGRTGRKRAGFIHVLLAEGREENNVEKAEAMYKEVQKMVNKGQLYELYEDVERLIPDHIKPECIEKVVEIQQYVREDGRKKASPKKTAATKRKRNDDVGRNIPDGASTGFVSVRDLVVKGAKKTKKVTLPKDFDALGKDDETDEELESGSILPLPRRTQSAIPGSSKAQKPAAKGKLRKAATLGGTKASKPVKKKTMEIPTSSQFSQQGMDDSDDMDIESGIISLTNKGKSNTQSKAPVNMSPTPEPSPKRMKRLDDSVIELFDESGESHASPIRRRFLPRNRSSTPENTPDDAVQVPSPPQENPDEEHNQDMSWLVDEDDDNLNFEIVDSSPIRPKLKNPPALERMQIGDESIEISHPIPRDEDMYVETSDPLEALEDDSIQFLGSTSTQVRPTKTQQRSSQALPIHSKEILSSPPSHSTSPAQTTRKASMLPPPVPKRLLVSPTIPESSFPVRPVGNQAKRRRIIFDEPESPIVETSPRGNRRLHHRVESTPIRQKPKTKGKEKAQSKRAKPTILGRNANALFDGEAAHSGDDVSEGDSNSEDDEESESDRMFIKNSPATQMSPSYEQSQIYRRSLLTQVPGEHGGPIFANNPIRARPFGRNNGPRYQELSSSSPPPPDDELDRYDLGSFVVDDDEPIS